MSALVGLNCALVWVLCCRLHMLLWWVLGLVCGGVGLGLYLGLIVFWIAVADVVLVLVNSVDLTFFIYF